MFAEYLSRWGLTPDGDPTLTRNSRLLPVRWRGAAAMLKVVLEPVAKAGNGLMAWWRGEGAAHVLATDGDAILLERAEGKASQADFVQRGRDDEASRICAVVTRPHAAQWFAQLAPAAATQGGRLFRLGRPAISSSASERSRCGMGYPPRQHPQFRRAQVARDRPEGTRR
jgi:streptomycin 6-kinase